MFQIPGKLLALWYVLLGRPTIYHMVFYGPVTCSPGHIIECRVEPAGPRWCRKLNLPCVYSAPWIEDVVD